MNQDDLDRILSVQEGIVPSSGFVANVMETVQREANVPPPIPFPWKYALPGLAACAIALVALVVLSIAVSGASVRQAAPLPVPVQAAQAYAIQVFQTLLDGARAISAGWIALALLVSYASYRLSMRLTGA